MNRRDFTKASIATCLGNMLPLGNVQASGSPELQRAKPKLLSYPARFAKSKRGKPPAGCRPVHSLVMGWQARKGNSVYNFALFPVTNCGNSGPVSQVRLSDGRAVYAEYELHISSPGQNPRTPETIRLHIADFAELAGPGLILPQNGGKSFFGFIGDIVQDFFEAIGELAEFLGRNIGNLLKDVADGFKHIVDGLQAIFNVIKPILTEIIHLIKEARALQQAMAAVSGSSPTATKAMQTLLIQEAILLKNASLLPHQRLVLALNKAMQEQPILIDTFIKAARGIDRYRN